MNEIIRESDLDERDKKIVELLEKNARMPILEISRRIGISDVAVKKRIRRLEREGVIRGYTIKLDPAKIGYRARAFIGIDVAPENLLDVARKLTEMPRTKFTAITSGDHMLLVEMWARDNEELRRVIEGVSSLSGVRVVRPAIVVEVLKD